MDELTVGDNEPCAMLVAINSMLEMVLLVPFAILYLRIISEADTILSYELVAKSVAASPAIPLAAAIITRFAPRKLASPS
jgi:ACR3 family arsenite transporter